MELRMVPTITTSIHPLQNLESFANTKDTGIKKS